MGRELNLLQLYVQHGKEKLAPLTKQTFLKSGEENATACISYANSVDLKDASRECILESLLFFDRGRMSNKSAGTRRLCEMSRHSRMWCGIH